MDDLVLEEVPSYRAQIEALETGQSFSRVIRIDPDVMDKEQQQEIIRSLRLNIQPTVKRITDRRPDYRYTIETGDFRTSSRDICLVLAVTRIA